MPYLPHGKHANRFMEMFAHANTSKPDRVLHVQFFQELVCHHLQGIFWPCLQFYQNSCFNVHIVTNNRQLYPIIQFQNIFSVHRGFQKMKLQTWNQSIVQQLIKEGNMRKRLRKASPIGLMASTTCKFDFTRSIKQLYIDNGVASIFRPCKENKHLQIMHIYVREIQEIIYFI